MRSLQIPIPPLCLADVAIARPNGPWFDGSVPHEVTCRRHTRGVLLTNQNDACGWCETRITLASSHAEHIQPKSNSAYASLTFVTSNLIACCGKSISSTCGHHKGDRVLAAWVHPYNTPCLEGRFIYEDDGKMCPEVNLDPATSVEALGAIDTILNLNESVLRSKREALINDILNSKTYLGLSSDEIFTVVGEFRSVIDQYAS
ncbi:MAG: TIGR02646 family protein [Verrucomicrobiales bacterium]|nr:TIGR02646 family protein [Verrucomicrobiales bacterium]